MSIWNRIGELAESVRERALGPIMDALAAQKQRRREEAFSIALIALSAKMAKADGVVTDDEIAAFQDFFSFNDDDADKVRMIYRLAQQDVAGFDEYLARVRKLFDDAPSVLEDVLDCLLHVAVADGVAHPRELELIERAAKVFAIPPAAFHRIKAIHLGLADDDPHLVLGIEPGADAAAIRAAYRNLAREHHPDALISRGVPVDLVKIAEARMAAINAAYEQLIQN